MDRSDERTLVLLRHGKSDWSGGGADLDRPLAERGRRQAGEAGEWLAAHLGPVDLAVVSPARRARDTWQLAAARLGSAPPMRVDDRGYDASGHELLEIVRGLPDDARTVVLVGHNPGLEDLLTLVTTEQRAMTTSALAVIGLEGSWAGAGRSEATLSRHGRPPSP